MWYWVWPIGNTNGIRGGYELSYSLGEIFVTVLSEKKGDFIGFISNADWRDGGQDAALRFLNLDLGEVAAGFLGPGNWRPQRKAVSECFKSISA